jgi:hypothetical protein
MEGAMQDPVRERNMKKENLVKSGFNGSFSLIGAVTTFCM